MDRERTDIVAVALREPWVVYMFSFVCNSISVTRLCLRMFWKTRQEAPFVFVFNVSLVSFYCVINILEVLTFMPATMNLCQGCNRSQLKMCGKEIGGQNTLYVAGVLTSSDYISKEESCDIASGVCQMVHIGHIVCQETFGPRCQEEEDQKM